jgi:hypothetical protein
MKDMINKSVLFIGPSANALEGFDYSIIDKYDYIARTNTFLLDVDESNPHNRCDMLFINNASFRFYDKAQSFHSFKHKHIFTKVLAHSEHIKKVNPNIKCTCILEESKRVSTLAKTRTPYMGTTTIYYLIQNYQQVDICGMDFYQSGFGTDAKYIENYKAKNNTNQEEKCHNIKKDAEFLWLLYQKHKPRIRFLHKTKDILERMIV